MADSLFGAWLVRREGSRTWRALRAALESGRMPGQELADGALVLVGGTLMLTPGFVTDVAGLLLVAPFSRPFGRRLLARFVTSRFEVVAGSGFGPGFGPGPGASAGPGSGRPGDPGAGDGPVVPGEVVDPDEAP